jgi:hypothetical protein
MLRCHARPGVVASVAYISRTTGNTFAAYPPAAARVAAAPFTLTPAAFDAFENRPAECCKVQFSF